MCLNLHTALQHGTFTLHVVAWQREKNSTHVPVPETRDGILELQGVSAKHLSQIRQNSADSQGSCKGGPDCKKQNYDKDDVHMLPFKQGDEVVVSVKVIPRGGVGMILRSWRGPFKVSEVRQEGRWYILENGMITH